MKATDKNPKRKFLPFLEHIASTALWDDSFPTCFQYGIILISNIQILAILFQSRLDFLPLCKGIGKSLSVALNLTTMRDLIANGVDDTFIMSCLVFVSVYFVFPLITFFWIIRSYFSQNQIRSKFLYFTTMFGQVHLAFSFSVINIILLNIAQNLSSYSTSEYWIICCIISLLLIFNFSFGFFLAFFSYDPFSKFNLLSCHSNRFQVYTFILKASLTMIASLAGDPAIAYYLVTGLSVALLALRHYDLLTNFPFYHYRAMKAALIINSICLGTACVNIITIAMKQYKKYSVDDTIYIQILLTLITLWFWNSIFNKQILRSLELTDKELRSEGKTLKKLFAVSHFLTNTRIAIQNLAESQRNEVYFWSIIASAVEQLNDETEDQEDIPVSPRDNANTDIPDNRSHFMQLSKQVTRDLLKSAVEKLGKSDKVKTLLLSDCVGDPKRMMIAMVYLVGLSKSRDFMTRIIISKLKSRVEHNLSEFFEEQKKSKLDIRELVSFEAISDKFVRMIYTNSQTHLTFWKNYNRPDIPINSLYESSKQFESNHDKIHRFWFREIEPNRSFANHLVDIYSIYLNHIRNQPVKASKLQKKIAVMGGLKPGSEDIMSSHGTIVLHISMSKERRGNIVYASPHTGEVLGRSHYNLIGKSINSLIPLFVRDKHEDIMRSHLEDIKDPANSELLVHTTDTFILNESGYIVPCKVYLSLFPGIQNELMYIVVVQVNETEKDDYIIMGKDSYVEACSPDIAYNLNLSTGKRIFMPDICQNYHELKRSMVKIERAAARPSGLGRQISKTFSNNENVRRVSVAVYQNQDGQTSLNLALSFHRYKQGIQDMYLYDTQLTSHTFCNTPVYILRINRIYKDADRDEDRSELLTIPNRKDQDPESDDTSSNQIFEDNLNEIAKAPLTFEPLSSSRQGTARPLIDPAAFVRGDGHHLTDLSQRNMLLTYDQENAAKENAEPKQKVKKLNKIEEKLVLDQDQAVSVFTGREYSKKVENAIHFVPMDARLRVLKTLGVVLLFVSAAVVIGWQVQNVKTLGFVSGNIEVMSQTKYMLVQMLRMNRIAMFMVLIDQNLLVPARYLPYVVVTDMRLTIAAPLKTIASAANAYSNTIKGALYKIDPGLQQKIYQTKYTMTYRDNITNMQVDRKANIFDLVTEMVSQGLKAGNLPASQLNSQSPNIQFVVDNTLNDLLIGGELITPILQEDTQGKLKSLTTLVAIFFSVITLISLVIAGITQLIIQTFIKERNHFLDVFMRLDNGPVQEHITMTEKFVSAIERSHFGIKSDNLNIDKQYFKSLNTRFQNSKIIKRSADKKGIHKSLYSHSLAILVFIIVILMVYLALYLLSVSQANSITKKVDLMTRSEHYFYELMLIYSSQYSYIEYNKSTTIRGLPIEPEWKQVYKNLTQAQGFFSGTLLSDENGIGMNEKAVEIVKGNLCALLDPNFAFLCNVLGGGFMQEGLIRMNSFYMNSLQETITSFDNSNDTHSELVKILNTQNVATGDILGYYFTDKVYRLMTNLIQELLKSDIYKFQRLSETIIIIYTILCIVIAVSVWIKICRSLEKEISSWKKVVRQIPWEIITSNKFLKRLLSLN